MSGRRAEDRGAPASVLQQAVDRFEQQDGNGFEPAHTFTGARPGRYFGRGPSGVGYYPDTAQQQAGRPEPAPARDDQPGPSRPQPARRVDGNELLAEAEAAAGDTPAAFVDAKGLRKLAVTLERKYKHNVEQRAKHADEPQRFLESEIELDEAVKAMLAVATSPELYPDLVAAGCVPTLLALLHHDNGDIAADTIELLAELTDADAVEDSEAEAGVLVAAMMDGGLLEALTQRLATLNEAIPEEATAVYNSLAVVENCAELRPEAAEAAATKTPLLDWLLRRLRPRLEVDANKQYAAEVLAVVLQAGGDAARRRFAEVEGVDRLLQAVAPYRSRDPGTAEEEEFVENVFNALCVALLLPECRAAFVSAEGVELMLLVLKARRAARTAALKCLDFATTRCQPACNRVVDQGGLKVLFALFMGKLRPKGGAGSRRKLDEAALGEEEERCVSVVANLMAGVTGGSRRDRLAAKFVEAEFEKCDRLMEAFFRYEARVEAAAAAAGKAHDGEDEEEEEEEEEESMLAEQLGAGVFPLQRCALVAATLWACGDPGLQRRLVALLHQRGRTLGALRSVLLQYRSSLGGDGEDREQQVEDVTQLLAFMGHREEDGPAEQAPAAEAREDTVAGGGSHPSAKLATIDHSGSSGGGGKRQRSDFEGGSEGGQRAKRQPVE